MLEDCASLCYLLFVIYKKALKVSTHLKYTGNNIECIHFLTCLLQEILNIPYDLYLIQVCWRDGSRKGD